MCSRQQRCHIALRFLWFYYDILPPKRDESKGLVNEAIWGKDLSNLKKRLWVPNLHLDGVEGDVGLQQIGMHFELDAVGI